MSKVAIFSDLHFGAKKNSELVLYSQIRFIEKCLVPYLKKHKITKLFFLGDMFDNRSSINIKIKNEVIKIFENYLKDFDIDLIVGNHDSYFNSSIDVNSVKFFNKFDNVNVIDKITKVDVYGKKVVLVPWIVDQGHFIHEFKKFSGDICMGHFNINGFNLNKYKTSEDGLPTKLFGKKCKKVYSGHFHTRSTQKHYGVEIIYVGSHIK
jgi:DNA repair exonuclease SbcCD nuclease subunit